jgi:hypothetical protein
LYVYFNDVRKTLHHPTGRPAILDLYAGVGGMSLGLEKHFDLRWVVDNDHLAAATLRANKAGLDVCIYMEDVKTFLMHSMQKIPAIPQWVRSTTSMPVLPTRAFLVPIAMKVKMIFRITNKLCCS